MSGALHVHTPGGGGGLHSRYPDLRAEQASSEMTPGAEASEVSLSLRSLTHSSLLFPPGPATKQTRQACPLSGFCRVRLSVTFIQGPEDTQTRRERCEKWRELFPYRGIRDTFRQRHESDRSGKRHGPCMAWDPRPPKPLGRKTGWL